MLFYSTYLGSKGENNIYTQLQLYITGKRIVYNFKLTAHFSIASVTNKTRAIIASLGVGTVSILMAGIKVFMALIDICVYK